MYFVKIHKSCIALDELLSVGTGSSEMPTFASFNQLSWSKKKNTSNAASSWHKKALDTWPRTRLLAV